MEGTLALMIPILAISIPIIAIWTKHRQKIAEMQINATAQMSAEKAAQYAARTQALEERVRVLERIATDREGQDAAALAGQIEDLRTAAS